MFRSVYFSRAFGCLGLILTTTFTAPSFADSFACRMNARQKLEVFKLSSGQEGKPFELNANLAYLSDDEDSKYLINICAGATEAWNQNQNIKMKCDLINGYNIIIVPIAGWDAGPIIPLTHLDLQGAKPPSLLNVGLETCPSVMAYNHSF